MEVVPRRPCWSVSDDNSVMCRSLCRRTYTWQCGGTYYYMYSTSVRFVVLCCVVLCCVILCVEFIRGSVEERMTICTVSVSALLFLYLPFSLLLGTDCP